MSNLTLEEKNAPFILLRTYILYSDILVSRAFSIVCSYSYSLAIQYNGKLNLTSTRFVFSSMQNLLCTTDC